MSVEQTNRIIDPNKERAYQLRYDLQKKSVYKGHMKKKIYKSACKHFRVKSATCAKCKRGMSRKQARTQMENKENIMKWHGYAPICMACIMGCKRKTVKKDEEI